MDEIEKAPLSPGLTSERVKGDLCQVGCKGADERGGRLGVVGWHGYSHTNGAVTLKPTSSSIRWDGEMGRCGMWG